MNIFSFFSPSRRKALKDERTLKKDSIEEDKLRAARIKRQQGHNKALSTAQEMLEMKDPRLSDPAWLEENPETLKALLEINLLDETKGS